MLLGRLTREQRRKFRKTFPLLNGDYIERLALMGQGLMARHFALKPRTITANEFMRLAESVRRKLNDPSYPIELWDGHGGVYHKLSHECAVKELRQVTRAGKPDFLTPEEQMKRAVSTPLKPRKTGAGEELEKVVVTRCLDSKWVLLVGEYEGRMKILLKTLRQDFAPSPQIA